MRASLLIALLAAATPAWAQDALQRESEIRMEQDMARQRSIEQSNRMMALEAQIGAEQAIRQVEAQRIRPILPRPGPGAPPPRIDPGSLASIPDDRLDASNARVREASKPAR